MSKIAELSEGWVESIEKNEFGVVSKTDDPPKIRQGVLSRVLGMFGGRSLGCFSFDTVATDAEGRVTSRDEHVLMQGKRTEGGGGELYIGLKRPGGGSQDADMIDAITISNEQGIVSKLPIHAPNLQGGVAAAPTNALYSRNGKFWLVIQDDGNYVLYRNRVPYDYNTGVPYWSSGTVQT